MCERWMHITLYQAICVLFLYSAFSFVIWNFNKGINMTVLWPLEYNGISSERNNAYVPNNRMDSFIKYPLQFLPHFKNPCWREEIKDDSFLILCVPYYFLVGAPKCGTTDLHRRLLKHKLISQHIKKENHWITRRRFTRGGRQPVSVYLGIFSEAVQKDITAFKNNGYYNSIFGDSSASTLWDNRNLLLKVFTANMKIPPYSNANVVYNLNPRAKVIAILRNPITRTYSDYLYFKKNTSVLEFHRQVVSSVQTHEMCLKNNSLRYCAYFVHGQLRLHIGLYYIYIEDYFRVFPREQIQILRLEDLSRNISRAIEEVFTFLEMGVPAEHVMKTIRAQRKSNANTRRRNIVGEMFARTWTILYNFYKPYNDRLGKLLGIRYNYNSLYYNIARRYR